MCIHWGSKPLCRMICIRQCISITFTSSSDVPLILPKDYSCRWGNFLLMTNAGELEHERSRYGGCNQWRPNTKYVGPWQRTGANYKSTQLNYYLVMNGSDGLAVRILIELPDWRYHKELLEKSIGRVTFIAVSPPM